MSKANPAETNQQQMKSNSTETTATSTLSEKFKNVLQDFNLRQYPNYISTRCFTSAAIASALGATTGYYLGDKAALYFYTSGIWLGAASFSFFSTVYGLKELRKADDCYNYSAAGAFTGLLMVRREKKPLGVGIGAMIGLGYYFGSTFIYQQTREMWLTRRRYVLEHSRERRIVRNPNPILEQKYGKISRDDANSDKKQ